MKIRFACVACLLFFALQVVCQNNISTDFQNQKHFVDSLILRYNNITFQKQPVVGADKTLYTYKGYVSIDQSGIIKSIDLTFDSSVIQTTLFCMKDSIIALTENGKLLYKMKAAFYTSNGTPETCSEFMKRIAVYEDILKVVLTLFKP